MTEIKLYNTATRSKEVFTPLDPDNVRMYVCGPTVYDRAHLGNARPALVFDVLYRLLRHVYGPDHVTYVRNITDVDDKINAEAQRRKEAGAPGTLEELIAERAEETIRWYHEDMAELGVLPPTHEPRATEYIAQMIAMIEGLIADGYAYENEGHVLFRVRQYADYGKLSGRSVDDMIAGSRVEVAPYKEDPMDFVLWKPSSDELPGWDSPWGRGRPGWHIECSAMAAELLGETFDIHGGGNDLQFPHHENEIAQSKCAGHGFAKVWMHNEMILIDGEKMSKSLGNFVTVRQALQSMLGRDDFVPRSEYLRVRNTSGRMRGRPLARASVRLSFLMTHYRSPMDWTFSRVAEADRIFQRLRHSLLKTDIDFRTYKKSLSTDLIEALSDDLNTPEAVQILNRAADRARRGQRRAAEELLAGMEFLGILDDTHVKRRSLQQSLTKFVNAIEELEQLGIKPDSVLDYIEESSGRDYRKKTSRALLSFSRFLDLSRTAESASSLGDHALPEVTSREREKIFSKVPQSKVVELMNKRGEAKKMRNFELADRIRSELEDFGIEVVDTSEGPRWRPADK